MTGVLDLSIVKAFGQIAGIGGLSLLVFGWLFREVIRKKIFPQLSREHAYGVIKLFLWLVFALAIAGLAAWVYSSRQGAATTTELIEPAGDPQPVVRQWLDDIDAGDYRRAWSTAERSFIGLTEASFIELFESQRKPRGRVLTRLPHGSANYVSPPGYPAGHYRQRGFISSFEDGTRSLEVVTVVGTRAGWKVMSHTINPPPP